MKVVEWTTDPLVRRNAYFNLTKLGAEADAYLVNFYGEMADGLNAGGESDRLVIRWHLDSPRSVAAASGHAGETTVDNLVRDGAVAVLTEGAQREPVSHPGSARVLLCRVPEDIVAVRRSDPVLARAWRMALRRTLMDALGAGFRVSGATRSGWYVLER